MSPESNCLLPGLSRENLGKKTLVLDLDETLVHSTVVTVETVDAIVWSEVDGVKCAFYVRCRPGLKDFIETLAPLYELVVFTASMPAYANQTLDVIDPEGLISHRLFRDSCTSLGPLYVKDLSRLGRSLSQTILIDVPFTQNNPDSSILQPENFIHISSFFGEKDDVELLRLIPILKAVAGVTDVREILNKEADLTVSSVMNPGFGKRNSDVTDGTATELRPEFNPPK